MKVANQDKTMCMKAKTHCIVDTKMIFKTLREGCLAGPEGMDLSVAVGENGDQEITG